MYHRPFVLCLSLCLFLSACKTQGSAFVPVTGEKGNSAPAQVERARSNVIKYAVSSARLASLPQDANWELEAGRQSENEYRYHNGDWLIIIRLGDADDGNKRVIICNPVAHASWTGYVTAENKVVDTTYTR